MSKKFDSEPVYGDNGKYMKTKIVSHGDKVNTNFHSKKNIINASYKCMSQIMIDFAIKVNKKYYLQAFLEESKYKIRKNKLTFFINDDLGPRSSGESDNEFDNDESND